MEIIIIDRTNEEEYIPTIGYTLNDLSMYEAGTLDIDFNAEYIGIGADNLHLSKYCSYDDDTFFKEAEQIKNSTPLKIYVISKGKLFYGLLEDITLCANGVLGISENIISAKYNIIKVYDVSNSALNIKLNLIELPETGVKDSTIERTIKEGTLIKEYT